MLTLSLCLTTARRESFKHDWRTEPITSGQADFTHYVALGNSLTAGYQDGALFRSGQRNSYPAILAKQMERAGRKEVFKQDLMSDDLGGISIPMAPVGKKFLYGSNAALGRKLVLVLENGNLVPKHSPGIPRTTLR